MSEHDARRLAEGYAKRFDAAALGADDARHEQVSTVNVHDLVAQARREALEEAAKLAERWYLSQTALADALRALKDKP